jgi:DUF1009 family protein
MIALIAGAGALPIFAAQKLTHEQKDFCILSLTPEDNIAALTGESAASTSIIPVDVFKVGSILKLLKEHNVTHIIFAGKVEKKKLLSNVQLDWLGVKLLAQIAIKSDKEIMEVIIATLAEHGISIISQHTMFGGLQLPAGTILGTISSSEQIDLELGMSAAHTLTNANIGQTVVIKNGMVVAVEALEGTTACIQRAYELAGDNLIICKTARDNHNSDYDLPTLGPATLEAVPESAIRLVAWQASHTLIVDQERFIAFAAHRGITLCAM